MASDGTRWAAGCLVCHIIGILLFAGLASTSSAQQSTAQPPLTPEQTQAIQQLIHDYLLQKSKVIVAALRNLQQKMVREKQVTAQEMAVAKQHDLVGDPTSPIGGNPQGDVTIVEFFDYRCPYCKAVEPSVEELLEEDAKLRIVYKEFPILGPRVGLCGKGCARRGKTRKIHVVP
jgi:protein-disulfide isomerase